MFGCAAHGNSGQTERGQLAHTPWPWLLSLPQSLHMPPSWTEPPHSALPLGAAGHLPFPSWASSLAPQAQSRLGTGGWIHSCSSWTGKDTSSGSHSECRLEAGLELRFSRFQSGAKASEHCARERGPWHRVSTAQALRGPSLEHFLSLQKQRSSCETIRATDSRKKATYPTVQRGPLFKDLFI